MLPWFASVADSKAALTECQRLGRFLRPTVQNPSGYGMS